MAHYTTTQVRLRKQGVPVPDREFDVVPALGSAEVVDPLVGVPLLTGHPSPVHQPLQAQILHIRHVQ